MPIPFICISSNISYIVMILVKLIKISIWRPRNKSSELYIDFRQFSMDRITHSSEILRCIFPSQVLQRGVGCWNCYLSMMVYFVSCCGMQCYSSQRNIKRISPTAHNVVASGIDHKSCCCQLWSATPYFLRYTALLKQTKISQWLEYLYMYAFRLSLDNNIYFRHIYSHPNQRHHNSQHKQWCIYIYALTIKTMHQQF